MNPPEPKKNGTKKNRFFKSEMVEWPLKNEKWIFNEAPLELIKNEAPF